MRTATAVLAVSLLCISIAVVPLRSQSPGQKLSFVVASIKLNKSVGGGSSNLGQRGGTVTITKTTVRTLMGAAYDLPTLSDAINRIGGLPNWADTEYYDIEAKAEGNPARSDKRIMLQSLLADRFKLVVHQETRQRPVFALVFTTPGKLGPQLHPHTSDTDCEKVPDAGNGAAQHAGPLRSPTDAAVAALKQSPCGRIVDGPLPTDAKQVWSGGRKVTMAMIAASLGGDEPFDRPILDATGITGLFDFTIVWHTLLQNLSTTTPDDPTGISLAEALRDQLGLKLVSKTGPVDVLIIDHVEKPTTN